MGLQRTLLSVFSLILLLTGFAPAQEMLVTGEWLAAHRNDPGLVILHVGSEKDYAAGHIPGARLITLNDIGPKNQAGLYLEMPAVSVVEEALGARGIDENSRVVIYHGTRSVQSATRVWFTFDYLGLGSHASLLDGGLELWRTEGRPISTESSAGEKKRIRASAQPEKIVSVGWVQAHLNDSAVQLLDARTPNFFSGEDKGMMPRGGHIPGAVNVPYPSFFDESGRLKASPELEQMLRLPESKTADAVRVTYCHIGQQATVLYFVARLLGMEVRLFDGSFQEWSNQANLPVEPLAEGAR